MSGGGGDLNNSSAIEGGTDSTLIGNTGDSLNVESSANNLLFYTAINEFRSMNENLKIIIKQLSYITDQEEDEEEEGII